MTAFSPGQSPPPVRIPTRMAETLTLGVDSAGRRARPAGARRPQEQHEGDHAERAAVAEDHQQAPHDPDPRQDQAEVRAREERDGPDVAGWRLVLVALGARVEAAAE